MFAKFVAKHQRNDTSPQPKNLKGGTLSPSQLEGYGWLQSTYRNGIHGILSDESGLGSNLVAEVMAVIGWLTSDDSKMSFIIAAPPATLRGWLREFRKWLPVSGQQNQGIKPLLYQVRRSSYAWPIRMLAPATLSTRSSPAVRLPFGCRSIAT